MRSAFVLAAIAIAGVAFGQNAPERPKITGIDHVMFYTTAPDGVARLYHDWMGLTGVAPAEPGEILRYGVGKQWVGFRNAPDAQAVDRMDDVAFTTDDLASLRGYLAKKRVTALKAIDGSPDGTRSFRVKDPEEHTIEFVERAKTTSPQQQNVEAVSRRLIHVGFIVRNRDREDAFYRDILGFHVYWYGGSEPGRTDWCAMQVPDGTDWLEYMLNAPAQPTARQLGGMNHISLGVENMQQTAAKLKSHGWQPPGDQQPKIGRDGKWQLNLRDPDLSRVELMEFRPAEKPCCSDFQGPHPGPDR